MSSVICGAGLIVHVKLTKDIEHKHTEVLRAAPAQRLFTVLSESAILDRPEVRSPALFFIVLEIGLKAM